MLQGWRVASGTQTMNLKAFIIEIAFIAGENQHLFLEPSEMKLFSKHVFQTFLELAIMRDTRVF